MTAVQREAASRHRPMLGVADGRESSRPRHESHAETASPSCARRAGRRGRPESGRERGRWRGIRGVSRVARGRGRNRPQPWGGRMQHLCNKFARDGRSEGAAEGGGFPRKAADRHQDRRTSGRKVAHHSPKERGAERSGEHPTVAVPARGGARTPPRKSRGIRVAGFRVVQADDPAACARTHRSNGIAGTVAMGRMRLSVRR